MDIGPGHRFSRSQLQGVLDTSSVSLLGLSPVNDLPDTLNVSGLVVQVLKR